MNEHRSKGQNMMDQIPGVGKNDPNHLNLDKIMKY